MENLQIDNEYRHWLTELKANIKQRQIKAALAVNSQLIQLYWDLGKQITEKQANAAWGSGFIDQLSKDLKAEFPEMGGFSRTNLFSVKKFYVTYNLLVPIIHQVGGQLELTDILALCCQIPWRHNVSLIDKLKDINEIVFYIKQIIENNWSRAVLEHQIEGNLYQRQGKAINNFKNTLPEPESDLANALLRDTYNFEFLTLSEKVKEADSRINPTTYHKRMNI